MHTEIPRSQRTTLRIIKRLVSLVHIMACRHTHTHRPTSHTSTLLVWHFGANIDHITALKHVWISLYDLRILALCLYFEGWNINCRHNRMTILESWKETQCRHTHRQPCCSENECSFTSTRLTEGASRRGRKSGGFLLVTLCSNVCPTLSDSQNDL